MARTVGKAWFESEDRLYKIRIEPYWRNGTQEGWRALSITGRGASRKKVLAKVRGSWADAEGDAQAILKEADKHGYLDRCVEGTPMTFGDLASRFLHDRLWGSSQTGPSYARSFRQIALRLPAGDLTPIAEISRRTVEGIVRVAASDGLSGATTAGMMRAGKALFRWAENEDFLLVGSYRVWRQKVVQEKGLRPWLRPEEIRPFLEHCPPEFKPFAVLALYAGLRRGEVVNLRWAHVDRNPGYLSLFPIGTFKLKSHQNRTIPCAIPVSETLAELPRESEYVFANDHGERGPSPSEWLCRTTHKVCRAAGVMDTDFHGLRRSFCCHMLNRKAGASIYEVSKMLGHCSVTVTEKSYAELIPSTLAETVHKIGW
jgi:integrase